MLSLLHVHIFNLGDRSWWVTWAKIASDNICPSPALSGINSEQHGDNELTLIERRSGSELDDGRPAPITDASTELKMEIVPKLKVSTQLRAQVPRLTISREMLRDVNIDLGKRTAQRL